MQPPPDVMACIGQLTKCRRDLHAHSELKFEETRTAGQVAAWNGAGGQPGVNLHNADYDFNDDILGPGASFCPDRSARHDLPPKRAG